MRHAGAEPVWNDPPERRFTDMAQPPEGDAERRLRAMFLGDALAALHGPPGAGLLIPPSIRPGRAATTDRGRRIHLHRYAEVAVVRRGVMTIWWEGALARCPAGSVLAIPPGLRYQPHAAEASGELAAHAVVWLALHRGCAVAHSCAIEGRRHLLGEYYAFSDPQITHLARAITTELAERAPHFETVLRGSLISLFGLLGRAPAERVAGRDENREPDGTGPEETLARRVEAFLRAHHHRPLSLADVARATGCSRSHLCRRFREETGQTPFELLRRVRMDAARRLLRSEVPISRVAEMVGFDDPFYFSKVFAAETGESPQLFRSRARNEAHSGEPHGEDEQ